MKYFYEDKVIPTIDLKISDLPEGRLTWSKFSRFALTFDPRGEELTVDDMAEISKNFPRVDHTIKILRAFLYNWQRIQNNKTYEPSFEFLSDAQILVDWIRLQLLDPSSQE